MSGKITSTAIQQVRGAFIVVEGLDRAGKSTQVTKLIEKYQAKSIKFPQRQSSIGKMIDSYLQQKSEIEDHSIHLLFSANRWEHVDWIINTLNEGQNIVCDRYAFSGIAYSCAKGLSYDWCRSPDIGLPSPDLTLFLSLTPEVAAQRGGYGEERYEALTMQKKVREVFEKLGSDTTVGRWRTIDAGQAIDKVTEDCVKEVNQVIESIKSERKAIGKLFI